MNILRELQWWFWYRWSKISRSEREQIRIIRNTHILTTTHKAELLGWFVASVKADLQKARSTTEAK